MRNFKIAVVQATPVFLDREATVEKACAMISSAAQNGASLVVFPEAFIPGYPDWVWRIPPREHSTLAELYAELLEQSVAVPDESTEKLCLAAGEAGVYVAIGINERNAEASGASLYNSVIHISPEGEIIGKRRKLMPTAPERMVWAQGDGSTLEVYDTGVGRIGSLICWENYMPLARYALYADGMQIHLAPTWDRGEPWLSTLRHVAKEGRVYVVGCSMTLRKEDIPERLGLGDHYAGAGEWLNTGGSAIVDPAGNFIAGPLDEEEGVLYADIDLRQTQATKWNLDVAGHYARPDIFRLTVNKEARPMISTLEAPPQIEAEDFVDERTEELHGR